LDAPPRNLDFRGHNCCNLLLSQAERQRFEELLAEERREKEALGRKWWQCSW